jgi:hypothetical protein
VSVVLVRSRTKLRRDRDEVVREGRWPEPVERAAEEAQPGKPWKKAGGTENKRGIRGQKMVEALVARDAAAATMT